MREKIQAFAHRSPRRRSAGTLHNAHLHARARARYVDGITPRIDSVKCALHMHKYIRRRVRRTSALLTRRRPKFTSVAPAERSIRSSRVSSCGQKLPELPESASPSLSSLIPHASSSHTRQIRAAVFPVISECNAARTQPQRKFPALAFHLT